MTRKQMIRRLSSRRKPLIVGYGCYATGIEFRILTSGGGCFCYGGGSWPICGPARFGAIQFRAAKALNEQEFSCGDGDLASFLEDAEVPLTRSQAASIRGLEEQALRALLEMAAQQCKPGRSYFFYRDECDQQYTFFRTYREAQAYVIDVCTGKIMPWKDMSEEELTEWVDHLEATLLNPFDGSAEVQPLT